MGCSGFISEYEIAGGFVTEKMDFFNIIAEMSRSRRESAGLDSWSAWSTKRDMDAERQTVEVMIRIYCRAHHEVRRGLCSECEELLAYAVGRIGKCRFGMNKPVCNRCTVHCFSPAMRQRIQAVMCYAGPRMLWSHPVLAVRHLLRSKRYSGKRSK
jgi:hypothetical protein